MAITGLFFTVRNSLRNDKCNFVARFYDEVVLNIEALLVCLIYKQVHFILLLHFLQIVFDKIYFIFVVQFLPLCHIDLDLCANKLYCEFILCHYIVLMPNADI